MINRCAHSWEPVFGWNGRYTCRWCKVKAYRNMVRMVGKPDHLTVYVCKKCTEPAVYVQHRGGYKSLCMKHAVEAGLWEDNNSPSSLDSQ